jgi:hypothetical protein
LRHLTDVVLVALVLCVAVLAILRPVTILRWAKRAHPDLQEDDNSVLWVARIVGLGGLGVAIAFLVIIVRSLSR